jgi:hypothetical protein
MRGNVACALVLLLGLTGCNRVVSVDPWFTAVDAEGAPKLRDGLWLIVDGPECRVRVERPAERWPGCAGALYVRGNEWLTMQWDDPDGDGPRRRRFAGWHGEPAFLVRGDPLIGQSEIAEPEPGLEPDDELSEDDEPDWRYVYFAVRPTQVDDHGSVLAFETWSIVCGPLSEPVPAEKGRAQGDDEAEEPAARVTDRPFPGLAVVGDNCIAESVDAVRRAAVLSEPLDAHGTARWVRDGWR